MKLVRLIYSSAVTRDMSLQDLKSILDCARSNNSDLGICGMLCYENNYFLQVLEGDRAKVSELFIDIADDPRHDEIELLGFEYIEKPLFDNWKMGYAGGSPIFQKMLEKLEMDAFEPGKLTPRQALAFLHHLSSHQSEI